jgi:hypothetical protein
MGDDDVGARDGAGAAGTGEPLVWHQELICPGEPCRGRVRRFPPGELVDGGRRERRRCPVCGTSTTAPAFYLLRGDRGARGDRPSTGACSDR